MEDSKFEIFRAIKQDNVELFSRSIGDNYGLCYGRFPLLTLLYLYNSKKIIKKYEAQLIKIKTYTYIDENIEMYLKFKGVAGRSLRLYVGDNKVVSPLEMLLILGEATKVEKLYKDANKSNLTKENLKMIESIKSSRDIDVGETKISIPKQPITKSAKRIVTIVACITVLMLMLSIFSAFIFIRFGIGTERNPYYVTNANQLIKAISTNSYIKLGEDIKLDSLSLDEFNGIIDGDGHELTVENYNGALIKKLNGEIKNIKITLNVDIEVNVDTGLLVNINNGDIDNIELSVSGKVKYVGSATTDSVFIGVIAQKNQMDITNSNITLDLEVIGNGTSDVIFGGIASRNEARIKECNISGNLKLNEVNGGGCCYENVGYTENIISSLNINQTSQTPGVSLMVGGITVLNTYSMHGCVVSGDINVENMTEYGVYTYIGGICALNYSRIDECKFSGKIDIDTHVTIVRAGGICALSKYYPSYAQNLEPILDGCAAVGKIDVSFEDTGSQGYIGGLIGEASTYTEIEKSFSTMDLKSTTSEDILIICGIIGIFSGDLNLENNAYLKTDTAPHGICTYNMFYGYRYYDSGDGMFYGYDLEDEIKALEIYW